MTRNGKDIVGSQPVLPPRPDLDHGDAVMALLAIRSVVTGDQDLRCIVARLNDLQPRVPLSFPYATLEWPVRVCPPLLADGIQNNITNELRQLREPTTTATTGGTE